MNDEKFTFKVGMGERPAKNGKAYEVGKLYGVQVYPTNYLIDSEGKVAFRCVGFDEAGIRSALDKLGVK